MAKLSSLSFDLNFKTSELSSLTLPIEIRKPNMALVTRALSSDSVDISPGEYFVSATLPAGQALSTFIKVGEDTHEKVVLSPEPEDESPHETHEARHFFLAQEVVNSVGMESLGIADTSAKIRCFAGNIFRKDLEDVDLSSGFIPLSDTATIELRLHGQESPMLVQLLQDDLPPINIAVPASGQTYCTLVIKKDPDGTHKIDAQLEQTAAELLLRYCEKGLFEQAATAINGSALDAKKLLYDKKRDPVAAAVGAYSLLRFGKLEFLHDWTANLKDWFTWLPDGVAIRGEHLARLGQHDEALDVFLELASRGLPLFSDGLTFVTDRLRLYESMGEKEFGGAKLAKIRNLQQQLQAFVPFVDFGKSILTYTGLDPRYPDRKALDYVPSGPGLDVIIK